MYAYTRIYNVFKGIRVCAFVCACVCLFKQLRVSYCHIVKRPFSLYKYRSIALQIHFANTSHSEAMRHKERFVRSYVFNEAQEKAPIYLCSAS